MSATAKAHGMDGGLVEPDWAPLTLDEVRALLEQFPAHGRFRRPAWWLRQAGVCSSSGIIEACAIAKGCLRSIAS